MQPWRGDPHGTNAADLSEVRVAISRPFWNDALSPMADSFSTRLQLLDTLQTQFAHLLAETAQEQLRAKPGQPLWIQIDGPPGHGKSAVAQRLREELDQPDGPTTCAWIHASSADHGRPALVRQILHKLARRASPLGALGLRLRIVLAAAPGVLAQRYLPASLLVLAVLLVLSDPRSLSVWGFLLAGIVAAISVVAAWTGREAPLHLARPALRQLCQAGSPRLFILLDDLDLLPPTEALHAMDDLRTLTRDLPIGVFVACDRAWLSQALGRSQSAPAEAPQPNQSTGQTLLSRYFDLSITIPLRWKEAPPAEASESPTEIQPAPLGSSPSLLLRHRLGSQLLSRIYKNAGIDAPIESVSLWALLCLQWPRLAEFLATYPVRVANFRYEQQPPEAPPEIAALFNNPSVTSLLRTPDEKVALDEKTLRALLAPFPPRRPPLA